MSAPLTASVRHGAAQRLTSTQHGRTSRGRALCVQAADIKLVLKSAGDRVIEMKQPMLIVGSGAAADLRLSSTGVAERHAQLESKGGRLLCTALAAAHDPDGLNLLAPTGVWLNGVEIRPGTAYMVAPGATLAFGSPKANQITVEFEEAGGAGGMADMLLQGMLSQASTEVQEQYKRLNE